LSTNQNASDANGEAGATPPGREQQPAPESGDRNAADEGHFVNSGPNADDAGAINDSQQQHSRASEGPGDAA
jgi:hypothetical protein